MLFWALLLAVGWPEVTHGIEHWPYNMRCYDCAVVNNFYCATTRACEEDRRRCLTISVLVDARGLQPSSLRPAPYPAHHPRCWASRPGAVPKSAVVAWLLACIGDRCVDEHFRESPEEFLWVGRNGRAEKRGVRIFLPRGLFPSPPRPELRVDLVPDWPSDHQPAVETRPSLSSSRTHGS
ncbi:glycosyl-phosphatidylinositol-anchored molecule-like protein [Canis lupus dingo]|uniref:glycosyl-phosphatidylinositol-anchored molecule-like protein n=1 Tax=Canis lupus dingo TaxID=286419 RepID=UPI0020C1BE3E|nr:glycosyl-phosphatidylinositol-anchored molecule-like protein [Canis lupus dingo]